MENYCLAPTSKPTKYTTTIHRRPNTFRGNYGTVRESTLAACPHLLNKVLTVSDRLDPKLLQETVTGVSLPKAAEDEVLQGPK